jgi:hypothetical protein
VVHEGGRGTEDVQDVHGLLQVQEARHRLLPEKLLPLEPGVHGEDAVALFPEVSGHVVGGAGRVLVGPEDGDGLGLAQISSEFLVVHGR